MDQPADHPPANPTGDPTADPPAGASADARAAAGLAEALRRIEAEREARTGRLHLANLGLRRLPEALRELDWLEVLWLGGLLDDGNVPDEADRNAVTGGADGIGRLRRLLELDCSFTDLADLRPLAGLTTLESLDCSDTQVRDLRPLTGLTALKSLKCSQTQVSDIGPFVGLGALESFICFLTQVSDRSPIAGLNALKVLDCEETEVSDLGALVGVTALELLDCRQTNVSDLGPLAGLPALRTLRCLSASITAPPFALIASQTLKELLIGPCPALVDVPEEVLSRGFLDNCLPRLRAHLADVAVGAAPLRDVKVIVFGNGRLGKTQLCRRLRGEPFEPDADSTHGISLTSVELPPLSDQGADQRSDPGPGQDRARLNLWDFGGQGPLPRHPCAVHAHAGDLRAGLVAAG